MAEVVIFSFGVRRRDGRGCFALGRWRAPRAGYGSNIYCLLELNSSNISNGFVGVGGLHTLRNAAMGSWEEGSI